MILDGQLCFSNLANGDTPTAVADNPSANTIDQQVKGGLFTGPGGSYVGMWLYVKAQASSVSAGGGTIQAVLQDSPDNITWTDQLLGPVTTVANSAANNVLLRARIPAILQRYVRVIYRIATAVFTAGTYIALLVPDTDIIDLSQRKAEPQTSAEPTGAMDESVNQGVLGQ